MITEKYLEHNTLLPGYISELQVLLSVIKSTCRNMMKWGYSQHWTKTLLQFTGDNTYNTTALLDYFKPLDDYLTEYLNSRSIVPGWDESKCPFDDSTTTAKPWTTTMTTNTKTSASTPTTATTTSPTATISSKPTVIIANNLTF